MIFDFGFLIGERTPNRNRVVPWLLGIVALAVGSCENTLTLAGGSAVD